MNKLVIIFTMTLLSTVLATPIISPERYNLRLLSLTPILGYEGRYTNFTLEWTFFDDKKVYTRMGFKW